MSDYSNRPDEMLRQIEELRPIVPEQAVRNLQDAVAKYKPWRKEGLDDLLTILEDDDEDESARTWSAVCSDLRADAPGYFEDALDNIELTAEGAAKAYRWQLTVMSDESKFFEVLGQTNAAQVRDYIVANRFSLAAYTETLDQKWRAIVEKGNQLQTEEQKLYQEMLDMTKRILEELKVADRTLYEDVRSLGQYPLIALEKGGGMLADLIGLPDGVGEVGEAIMEKLREKNEQWLEANRAIQGRATNYRALVQAEAGGVLPLFRETREDVAKYWERNNVDRATDWMKRFQESLEAGWIGACPTTGQQSDAKDFYKAALERVQRHFDALKQVAGEFETTWNGVFKGALRPDVIDELTDEKRSHMNAQTLIDIGTPEVVDALLKKIDGYYEPSFAEPLSRLKQAAEALQGDERERALRIIEDVRKRVEESVRARIRTFQSEVGASIKWFAPDEIKKTLSRDEILELLK